MLPSAAARPEAMRRANLSLVLRQIHRDGALTRAELTHRLGLSRSTIGALVADLTELGLLEESVPSGGTRAGRPSFVVGPHHHGPYVVAVDVDVTQVTTAAIGLGGTVLARHVVDTEQACSAEQVARLIVDSVPTLQALTGNPTVPVTVGVSVPGTVDRYSGTVGFAPNLGWRNEAFGAMLTDLASPHLPVVVGNDADLAVLAEHSRGSARGYQDVVYLIGRFGLGAGIIANGTPLRGHDGHAGEIGHNVVDASGPPCHCGKRGCLETYVGAGALLGRAGVHGPANDERVHHVLAQARAGDERAVAAVTAVAEALGRGIASLVNTLNPQLVVLGDTLADILELGREDLERSLARWALDAPGETVQLVSPSLGEDSALLGAAEIAFEALLDNPVGRRALLPR